MTDIRVQSIGQLDDFDRINKELQTLINTVEGTVPGYRAFGLSADVLDANQPDAPYDLMIDLEEKAAAYIPEVQIEDVGVESQDTKGNMQLNIQIKQNEDGEVSEE